VPPDMEKEVHQELFNKCPDRNKFFLDYLRGWNELSFQNEQIKKFGKNLIDRTSQICKESDDLKQQNQDIIKKKITELKKKNHFIMDKVLSVYNLIETIA
jgi:DNA-binding transcriptional MerR regulator